MMTKPRLYFEKTRTIFVLKDGSVHDLQDILSVVENKTITVKRTFHDKLINILVDTDVTLSAFHLISHHKTSERKFIIFKFVNSMRHHQLSSESRHRLENG
jgi:hypothetical protein